MERTNFRYLTPEDVGEELDFCERWTFPLSRLKSFCRCYTRCLKDGGTAVCLIKPQFEAGAR